MRFRLLIIALGAALVALTFTFPLWFEFIQSEQSDTPEEVFPGLSAEAQIQFQSLPPDQQAAYLQVAETDRTRAVAMIEAALSAPVPAPTEQMEMPAMTGATTIAAGTFTRIDAVRWAQGTLTIYQQVDNSKILRFEDFSVSNGPALRVALSIDIPEPDPDDEDAEPINPVTSILETGLDLGPLLGTIGNQNYDIPPEIDVTLFDNVVIYSPTLEMIYSIAPLAT